MRPPAIPSSGGLGETCLRLGEGVVSLALLAVLFCSRAEPAGLLAQAPRSDVPFAFSKRSMTFRTLDDAARIGTLPARLRLACRLVGWGCDAFAEGAAAVIGEAAAAANSGVAGGVAIIAQVPRQLGNNLYG